MTDAELNITEPHDFENEQLVALDTSLRCGICKDLINLPEFAPCSHSFCSMCIRESLSVKAECPICRTTINDNQLKKNTMLQEISEAYKMAREVILHNERAISQSRATVLGKRKRSDASMASVDTPPRATRMKSDTSNSSAGTSRVNSHSDSLESPAHPKGLSMVSCPVCDEILDAEYINQHLDRNCELNQSEIETSKQTKEGKSQVKAWASLLGPGNAKLKSKVNRLDDIPTKRMAKVNYDIKSTKQLRELLADVGLNDKGEVVQLKQRHERFINLWNSEVNAPKPRPRNVLLREMAQWENAITKSRPAPKVDSAKEWLDTNRNQFDELVENARPKTKDPKPELIDDSSSSSPQT